MAKYSNQHIDKHIGKKLREVRMLNGVSQSQIADFLNITFQQVQKYESGINKMSASRLYEVSKLLGCDVAYFFDGSVFNNQQITSVNEGKAKFNSDQSSNSSRDVLSLVRYFSAIQDKSLRKKLIDKVKAVSKIDQ